MFYMFMTNNMTCLKSWKDSTCWHLPGNFWHLTWAPKFLVLWLARSSSKHLCCPPWAYSQFHSNDFVLLCFSCFCFVLLFLNSPQSSQQAQTIHWFCGGKNTLKYDNNKKKKLKFFKLNELSIFFLLYQRNITQISLSSYKVNVFPIKFRRSFKYPPGCPLVNRPISEFYLKIHPAYILRSGATYNFAIHIVLM